MFVYLDSVTCTHHAGKHPALSVLDWVAILSQPLIQDGVTAAPMTGWFPAIISVSPASLQDATVILAVNLK